MFRLKAPKDICSVPLFDTTFYLSAVCREDDYPTGYFDEMYIPKPSVVHFLAKPLFYASTEYAETACRFGRRVR